MLHFNGLEPVDFKGRQCQPSLNAEKKLRLQGLKFQTEEQIKTADEVLASCFPDDSEYVAEFIKNKLSVDDKQVLRTYLVGGETALNRLSKATDGVIEKYITRAVDELPRGLENGE